MQYAYSIQVQHADLFVVSSYAIVTYQVIIIAMFYAKLPIIQNKCMDIVYVYFSLQNFHFNWKSILNYGFEENLLDLRKN